MSELDKRRIAIIPFANISPDPKDEYFADGLTEELISTTSSITGLTLIARTSVMRYKALTKGIDEIGRELNVGTILGGSVRKAGNRLRITVQLIDVQSQAHLWAQSYDRGFDDVFAVQSDIAKQVADALKVRVLPDEQSFSGATVDKAELRPRFTVDAPIKLSDSTKKFVDDLGFLEPFGNSKNPYPVFHAQQVMIVQQPKLLKDAHVKCSHLC